MIRYEKGGLIYCPSGEHEWEMHSFMTPIPFLLDEHTIRLYGAVRDAAGVARIKFIDVSAENPSKIIRIADTPCLDIGEPGCFDDNGMILGSVLRVGQEIHMYYVGFQHVQKVKFYAFSGLAISVDGGETFQRYSSVPISDRTELGKFGRCIHTVLPFEDGYRVYYALIHDWKTINGVPYPVYNIWMTESADGKHIVPEDTCLCVDVCKDEYRIGAPRVYPTTSGFEMYYTADTVNKEYRPGYAVSKDGVFWERRDDLFMLHTSDEGWDSQMVCYPAKICLSDRDYIFYNGNGMGRSGVGYATLWKE